LFSFPGSAFSQILTVLDRESLEPIELATVISEKPQGYTLTNVEGQADVSDFRGSPRIAIRFLGYESVVYSYAALDSLEFEVLLNPSNLNLEEVVLSATRWRQASDNVPLRIVSISPSQLSLQNPQTAADLLALSGKVYIQKSQQGGGSPMIRGFATNRLLYTVDGVRMNNAIFRGGNIQNVINVDPFAVEGAEVLFGPGSVMYGSDAIGGVMSFQTLTPQFSLTDQPLVNGKAVMRYASANRERTGHVDVNVGGKKWSFVTSLSSWDYDHLRQGSRGPEDYLKPFHVQRLDSMDRIIQQEDPLLQIPSAYSQLNLMQKVRFRPNARWDLQYGFHFSETSPYGRYDRHNRLRNGGPRYGEWDYGPQQWMMNHLNLAHSGSYRLFDQFTLRLSQQTFGESRISRDFQAITREIREEKVQAYAANLDFLKAVGEKSKLYYGFEYVDNEVNSVGKNENILEGSLAPGPSRYPQATWQSLAVYLNEEYQASERLSLQAGLRYNRFLLDARFDTTFFPFPFTTAALNKGSLTGSLGGVYRPAESWVLSANFGTAFRAPNVDDIGKVFDSEPGAVTVPNPDLQAEYAYSLDVGLAKVLGDFIKIDLSGYYTLLQNALVRRNFQLNGRDSIRYDGVLSQVQAIQNAAQARVYGLQAGLEVKFPAGFSFSSDFNLQRGEEELNDGSLSPSRHAAPMFGTARLNYRTGKLHLQAYLLYQGEISHDQLAVEERNKDEIYAKDENGNTYAPAWYTLNFKLRYTFSDDLSVSAGVENLTDQRYRPYSSGISGPGRNFVISFQAGF
jgi:hemoglobin/transferrin/lactoferrin receptor protein